MSLCLSTQPTHIERGKLVAVGSAPETKLARFAANIRTTGLMDEMLQLPAWRIRSAAPPGPAPADVSGHLWAVWARLTAADRGGDAVIAAALNSAEAGDEAVERFIERLRRRSRGAVDLGFDAAIYDCAAEALAADEVAEAWVGLVVLLDNDSPRSLAMLGLAVCAARLGNVQDALSLALASRARDPGHPRALLIAGYLEVQRGCLRRAQQYFAVASRLARHGSGFAGELRLAQRLLLAIQAA